MSNLLLIFAKEPELGKVKTRLAKDLGREKALRVYQQLLKKTRSTFKRTPYKTEIYFTARQKGRDLGARMFNAFKDNLKKYNKVIIIGVDCPFITRSLVRQAFKSLDHSPLVLGPTLDGGYYLIGLTQVRPKLFRKISWGTDKVLKQTLKHCKLLGIKPVMLKKLYDIDTIKEYQKWRQK